MFSTPIRTFTGRCSRPVLAVLLLIGALAIAPGALADSEEPGFIVVVNEEAGVDEISAEELGKIFVGRSKNWPNGLEIKPVELSPEDPVRAAFSMAVLGKSVDSVKEYWQRQIFSGRSMPPPERETAQDVLKWLLGQPGGIGYVTSDVGLPGGLQTLRVLDGEGQPINAEHRPSEVPMLDDPSRKKEEPKLFLVDETTDSIGPIRLFLTGNCGALGRHTILENRHPKKHLSVTVEVARHVNGELRSTRQETMEMIPFGEFDFDCTKPEEGVEFRVKLVEVSDVSLDSEAVANMTPREVVHLVKGESCGEDRKGRVISVVNRHPAKGARAEVEYTEGVEGGSSRTYRKTYALSHGQAHPLGCNRDGKFQRTHSLVKIEFMDE